MGSSIHERTMKHSLLDGDLSVLKQANAAMSASRPVLTSSNRALVRCRRQRQIFRGLPAPSRAESDSLHMTEGRNMDLKKVVGCETPAQAAWEGPEAAWSQPACSGCFDSSSPISRSDSLNTTKAGYMDDSDVVPGKRS